MAIIGSFTPEKDGYVGTIRTLSVNVKARFIPNPEKKSEGAPDFRIVAGAAELGAAWKARTKGQTRRDYLSVRLDDPSFPRPIHAALLEDDGAARLVWSRREERDARRSEAAA